MPHCEVAVMIGQFNDSYFPSIDGVVTCVYNYTRYLNQDHAPCTLYVPGFPRQPNTEPFPVVQFRSVGLPMYGNFRLGMPYWDRAYRKQVDATSFRLVHCHSPFMAAGEAFRIRRRQNVPVVGTFHTKFYDDFLTYTHSHALARWGTRYVIDRFNQMDSVWTVNEATVETLRQYGYKKDIIVVHNGTEFTMPEDIPAARARAEAACGIRPDSVMFLFVGQHILQKRIMMIAQAMELLRPRYGGCKLFMVGDGAARKDLEKWIQAHGLEDTVILMGRIQDREILSSLYLRANAFVFPSVYDNAPVVVREACAMGCPPIVAAGSNAAQGVEDGVNGFLCGGDAASLAAQMERIIQDPAGAARVGERARQTLAVTWESIVDAVYEHYQRIIFDYQRRHG